MTIKSIASIAYVAFLFILGTSAALPEVHVDVEVSIECNGEPGEVCVCNIIGNCPDECPLNTPRLLGDPGDVVQQCVNHFWP